MASKDLLCTEYHFYQKTIKVFQSDPHQHYWQSLDSKPMLTFFLINFQKINKVQINRLEYLEHVISKSEHTLLPIGSFEAEP